MGRAFQFSIDEEGIARLVFDLPGEKINKFSVPVLEELEQILDEAAKNQKIKIMAISSGKEGIFIAGADLHSFEPIFKDPSKGAVIIDAGHRVFNKLQKLPFPTVALIQGACLGGGTEMALACTYRVVADHPKTQIGLPEVTLGIVPGWGGTQRLPRLVGLLEGLPIVLSGKPVNAVKAWKIRLADAIYAAAFFPSESEKFLRRCLAPEGEKEIFSRRQRRGWRAMLLEKNPIGRSFVFRQAEKDVLKRTKGHYPAPLLALNLIKETYSLPLQEGLEKEAAAFKDNLTTSFANAPNLIYLFFVHEALKKESGVSGEFNPKPVASAGVLGAGTMGSGIAWLFSYRDIPVRMKDIDWKALGKGFGGAYQVYEKMIKDKKLKRSEASLKFHRMSGTTDYSGFKTLDIVIEAAVEDLGLKHQIVKELENVVHPDAIIGTNTSSLRVADIGSVMQHPERLVGIHFFNPVNKMPLVEVAIADKTAPEVIVTAVDLCRKLGKTPIVVRDCPGFLVNRIFLTGANEVMRMYEEGADFHRIEKMMLDFGMPMSPFELADEVGNDIGYKVGKAFEQAYGPRMAVPKIVVFMYENKLYGKKSGSGFYLYQGKSKTFNSEVEKFQQSKISASLSEKEMQDRVFLTMINEAARCLEEKIVSDPSHLDMATVMGIGFPPFRGGLWHYAKALGRDYVIENLERLQGICGERFTASEFLHNLPQSQ